MGRSSAVPLTRPFRRVRAGRPRPLRRLRPLRVSLIAFVAFLCLVTGPFHTPAPAAHAFADPGLQALPFGPVALSGTVVLGTTLAGVAGVTVNLYNASRVPLGVSSTTSSGGAFRFLVSPNATYFLVAAPSPSVGEGGGWVYLNASSSGSTGVTLEVWPLVGYDNATLVLPDYVNLSGYSDSPNRVQQPMLSWEGDGAYYVGEISGAYELLYDDFASDSLQDVASWTPLYENMMSYQGWLNNAFITEDGSWIYEFGCPSSCSTSGPWESVAVNVTTGDSFFHNWSQIGKLPTNPQVEIDMIGLSGNLSTEVVLVGGDPSQAATAYAYDPWNDTEWTLGSVPYFEANNIYWVPQLQSYIDVEAGGSSADGLAEIELQGSSDGTTLHTTYLGDWAGLSAGYKVNFVQGLYYNVTSAEIAATAGFNNAASGAQLETFVASLGSNGTIASIAHLWTRSYSCTVCGSEIPTVEGDEHRPTTVSGSPAIAAEYTGLFGVNDSWLVDPTVTNGFTSTNQSAFGVDPLITPTHSMSGGAYEIRPDGLLGGQFVNASRLIAPSSTLCASTLGNVSCPILGTTTGTSPGSVYYLWNAQDPEFAFPSDLPSAQVTPPGPVDPQSMDNDTAVGANWTLPASDDPTLNFSIAWNTTNGTAIVASGAASLSSSARSFWVPTPYEEETCISVTAWNLHWHDAPTAACGFPHLVPPGAPTGLTIAEARTTSIDLTWTAPAGPVENYTIEAGPSCSSIQEVVAGLQAPDGVVSGLSPQTSYCLEVVAWNSAGPSPVSAPAMATTANTHSVAGGGSFGSGGPSAVVGSPGGSDPTGPGASWSTGLGTPVVTTTPCPNSTTSGGIRLVYPIVNCSSTAPGTTSPGPPHTHHRMPVRLPPVEGGTTTTAANPGRIPFLDWVVGVGIVVALVAAWAWRRQSRY